MNINKILTDTKKIGITIANESRGAFLNVRLSLFFLILITVYLLLKLIQYVNSFPLPQIVKSPLQKIATLQKKFLVFISGGITESLSRIQLIDLAIHNMFFKKSRAIVTVGGMAIGIGSVVFLVSLGFGLEKVVTNRAARLDELQQAEVVTQPGSNQRLTDQTVAQIKDLPNVTQALPVIASVARISYESSLTDVPVYAVTAGYIAQSAIRPIEGKVFESEEVAISLPKSTKPAVAGVSTEETSFGAEIEQVQASIKSGSWVKVRTKPSRKSELVGYTYESSKAIEATKVWGESFPDNEQGTAGKTKEGNVLGVWLQAEFPIWTKEGCDSSVDCQNGYRMLLADDGSQILKSGYIAHLNVSTTVKSAAGSVLGVSTEGGNQWFNSPDVLGITDESESATPSSSMPEGIMLSADNEWVEIASSSAAANTKTVALGQGAHQEAVVNTALLRVLNISPEEAVGKKFSSRFVIPGALLDDEDSKIESVPAEYTIVGVIPGDDSAFFYVPFIDLRSLGITAYSQVKLIADTKQHLDPIRRQVESLGFVTTSVADTVKQIERLFASFRIVLISLGMVALSVAALGMFNTLTVSLLERTREVGLMKAMGMKSSEVKELFLIESLVMGFFGGVGGIILGVVAGKLLSVILSLISVSKQVGVIDVTYVPWVFILFIFGLSTLVGMTTGIFPARRATKISALNALRYE